MPPSPWPDLLRGLVFDEIGPAELSGRPGHSDAATALVIGGGAPHITPRAPLVVVVNDPDRATDTALALPAIRDAVGERMIRIVVATGSHDWDAAARAAHEAPLRAACGEPVDFHWHDARSPTHVPVGPARLDVAVASARDIVAIGSVEPHWFAGLTGAHKTLTVGVMHRDDIAANHALAMNPDARPFALAGNPVHEGFVDVLEALMPGRRIVTLNHVQSRWFGGRPLECLAEAASAAESRWLHTVETPFDYLVASVEPPLSRTLYQAEKGIKNNEYAVKDGGVLLLDAGCEDGLGPDRFFQLLLVAADVGKAEEQIARKGYRLGDHKAHRLRALQARGVRVGIVSAHFPAAAAQAAGIAFFASREEAADALLVEFGRTSRGAIVSDAAQMVVVPA